MSRVSPLEQIMERFGFFNQSGEYQLGGTRPMSESERRAEQRYQDAIRRQREQEFIAREAEINRLRDEQARRTSRRNRIIAGSAVGTTTLLVGGGIATLIYFLVKK